MAKKKRAAAATRRTVRRAASVQTLPVEKIVWLVLLAAVALVSAYIALVRFATVRVPAAVVESQVIALTNGERAANSLGTLTESPILDKAAQAKANDMAAKGYFSHTGPDGQPPWHWFVEAGYDYHYAGENLAVRFTDSKEVVDAWIASPTHKANIDKPQYQEIGVGIADGMYQGLPATFVVQFFGAPSAFELTAGTGYGDVPASTSSEVASPSLGKPPVTAVRSAAVLGSSITVPAVPTKISMLDRITGLLALAWRSLTANVAYSGGVVVGEAVSTER